jgi:hypothetical protein
LGSRKVDMFVTRKIYLEHNPVEVEASTISDRSILLSEFVIATIVATSFTQS